MPTTNPQSVSARASNPITFQHYRDLPAGMFVEARPAQVSTPALLELNAGLLDQLGLDSTWFRSDDGLAVLSGNSACDRNPPIAMAYSGHQFGPWVPTLGDGRAHMLGQMGTALGWDMDVQLKGSGRTPFSRGGDGRATLGSALREHLVSEAMAALGIPTTRSIAVVTTGDTVLRETALPGAILVRIARSHVRIGTFQYAAAMHGDESIQALADFMIAWQFPELADLPGKYLELLEAVVERQAVLIAKWMLVGFIHGVMNTDNMSIVGDTIDYGPCAFMDEFHPQKVFSSIDRLGRYAWNQQPSMALWNLARFAGTLLPLFDAERNDSERLAKSILDDFVPRFRQAFYNGMRAKLGIAESASMDNVASVADATLTAMADSGIDFTVFFDRLTRVANGDADALVIELFDNRRKGEAWIEQWYALKSDHNDVLEFMHRANPALIARNHRVEQALEAAETHGDFDPFRRLCRALMNPYEIVSGDEELQIPPQTEERARQTFCGT